MPSDISVTLLQNDCIRVSVSLTLASHIVPAVYDGLAAGEGARP
jgi:hypothetical protein